MANRAYCFTINKDLKEFRPDMSVIRYCVCQIEVSPTTGRDHIQGYAELLKPMKIPGFKKAINCEHAHVEKRMGTPDQARDYCMKEESRKPGTMPQEFGTWEKKQGKRSDLDAACEILKKHGLKRVAEDMPGMFVKFHRGLDALASITGERRQFGDVCELHIRWGETGTGKSHYVHEKHQAEGVYVKAPNSKWWDGYAGQRVVLIDDFEGGIDYRDILTWCDKYPVQVEAKGTMKPLNARMIYITSNVFYENWWKDICIKPFERRIRDHGSCVHLTEKYVPKAPCMDLVVQNGLDCAICGKFCVGACLD